MSKHPGVAAFLIGIVAFSCAKSFAAPPPDPDFSRAISLMQSEQFAEGAELLESMIERDPGKALYWFNLANAYYRLGRFEQAADAYRKVIELRSPLTNAAEFYLAESELKQGKTQEALRHLENLQKKKLPPHLAEGVSMLIADSRKPKTPQTALDQIMRTYETKDYPAVLQSLNTFLATTRSGNAQFLRGLALLRLRRPDEARLAFEAAVAQKADPDLQKDAQTFIRQIREGVWNLDQPYSAFFEFLGGYNSNVFTNGASEVSTAEPTAHAAGTLRYQTALGNRHSLLLEYRPQWDETFAFSELRLIENTFRAQFSHATDELWFFAVSPSFDYDLLGTSPYLSRPGVRFRIEKSEGSHLFGVSLDYDHTSALQPLYSYLAGSYAEGRAYWTFFTPGAEYFAFASVSHEGIGDLPLTAGGTLPLGNTSVGGGIGGAFFPGDSMEFDLNGGYFSRTYTDRSAPGNLQRVDGQFSINSRLIFFNRGQLKPLASVSLTSNQSTMGATSAADMNYQQWLFNFGFIWNAFP